MRNKLMIGVSSLALAFIVGCGSDATNTNSNTTTNATNANMKTEVVTPATEYETTTTTANGVTTETRVYKTNPRLSKVVITTRDGKRTAVVYNATGEQKELRTDDLDDLLRKSGDEIAKGAGFIADKAEDVYGKAKDAGEKTVEGAKTVGEKTAEGAKTVGNKAVQGAKKAGGAIKDAVTP